MTIRDYLKRRELLAKLGGWAFCLLIFFVAFRHLKDSAGPYWVYVWTVGLAVVGVMWVFQQQLIRCPRCKGNLLRLYTQISFGDVQACPHCGASFDEQYVG